MAASDKHEVTVDVPVELATALDENPAIARAFAALAPSHRRAYVDWIAQAKKSATRAARAQRALAMIADKQHPG
jgi:uncharacterized protein YdeI (YjbR/CyaY-like superfamily)